MTLRATFPGCRGCEHFTAAPAQLCFSCARPQLQLAGSGCPVCCQLLDGNGRCPNELCRNARRRIGRIHAVAYHAGALRTVINDYKYRGAAQWPVILGRLLLAWLDESMAADRPDLIVANPSFVGVGGQLFAHTEAVLAAATAQDAARAPAGSRWPFDPADPAAIVKTAATLRSADAPAWYKSFTAADLRGVLAIPDPARTAGKFVLVYDDICTTGRQLDTVAAALLDDGGAARVEGVVLARAPWRRIQRAS
jgi:predicted amidophosphoribosyltransferase